VIHGIGTDIVAVGRMREALLRHGARFAERILADEERAEFSAARDPARFLAKRFAAKEAFGKALGSGVHMPATLHAVAVRHDALGKPIYTFDARLSAHMLEAQHAAHISLSVEIDYVVAFAVIEARGPLSEQP
jgi:holo-[acyl-carrier protein] synthase